MCSEIITNLSRLYSNGVYKKTDRFFSEMVGSPFRSEPPDQIESFMDRLGWLPNEPEPRDRVLSSFKQSIRLACFLSQEGMVYRTYQMSNQVRNLTNCPDNISILIKAVAFSLLLVGGVSFGMINHVEDISQESYELMEEIYAYTNAVAYVAASVSCLALAALTSTSTFFIMAAFFVFETAYQFQLVEVEPCGPFEKVHDVVSVGFAIWRGNVVPISLCLGSIMVKYLAVSPEGNS